MYFKKLELTGFKSFCTKTTLFFEPGITAIVGPNGCGKSNFFDSIVWVLGEQSAKSLRGSVMQDVIFNGSDSKEPLNMAEVTVTFDNANRPFNVDQDEVAITRRIFRSGESEYLINRNTARLKDIQELLLGTGIGAESYSLVPQGKIDLILSSKPEDRRVIFDEASGISKFKAQKRETVRRLEETAGNLLRVNDIITEVRRQIGSLERQANKARRYKEQFDELKTQETTLALIQRKKIIVEQENCQAALTELNTHQLQSQNTILGLEAEINSSLKSLKSMEENILSVKNKLVSLGNTSERNHVRISSNQDMINQLQRNKGYLFAQVEQLHSKLAVDGEKLLVYRRNFEAIEGSMAQKSCLLQENESRLEQITSLIRQSLEEISLCKKEVLGVLAAIASVNNSLTDCLAKQQGMFSRKRRLEVEKAKVHEEKSASTDKINLMAGELSVLEKEVEADRHHLAALKCDCQKVGGELKEVASQGQVLEKQRVSLLSHMEFIERLRTKYEDISEAANVTLYIDKLPQERITGLVVKIKDIDAAALKLSGEAKVFDLDTQAIEQRVNDIDLKLAELETSRGVKENSLSELNNLVLQAQELMRNHDINLANKNTVYQSLQDEAGKIKDEEDIVVIELSDVDVELAGIAGEIAQHKTSHDQLVGKHSQMENLITDRHNSIASETAHKEVVLVSITQVKAELESLRKRFSSEEQTLKVFEQTFQHDTQQLTAAQVQIKEADEQVVSLSLEIQRLKEENELIAGSLGDLRLGLAASEDEYALSSAAAAGLHEKLAVSRDELEATKNKSHQLQMEDQEQAYRLSGLKERLLQNYKVDLDTVGVELMDAGNENEITRLVNELKRKIDSYGSVNLVAIEEYDELKKRYDFLLQQQEDLLAAKESLHDAILKINRTTKKMFLETFEKVSQEFKVYFRLMFNGGDAQIFLSDEADPLESGIEIICRPPGKKLQNILLLSGGEKSLSATALIFAIFKVKPAPFCILDEIDAALDEANVDRFGRILQEFSNVSQFIVITHNKKTIANANVMYGITMEESGVSKIVSVKFAPNKTVKEKELDAAVTEPDPV